MIESYRHLTSCCGTNMSQKCIKISSCVCFFILSGGLFAFSIIFFVQVSGPLDNRSSTKITFPTPEAVKVQCYLQDLNFEPSLESFIRASSTEEDQELRLRGLAVYSNLTNACQPPVDVSKSNILFNKIALITIANETECPLPEVAENAQNAGYTTVVIYLTDFAVHSSTNKTQTDTQDKILIPVLSVDSCANVSLDEGKRDIWSPYIRYHEYESSFVLDADQSYVEISIDKPQIAYVLSKMQEYLKRLYCWFLFGPLITLEWLRRTKKFCCMSGGQQVNEEHGTEDEGAVGETRLRSVVDETQENNNQETEHEQTAGEEQPLIIVTSDPHSNLTNTEHTRHTTVRRVTTLIPKIFGKFAVGCGYVILIIAALPVGISSGGWSFFRFDENENIFQKSFWDKFSKFDIDIHTAFLVNEPLQLPLFWEMLTLNSFLPLWWSPLQLFCFFLYSRFACKTTWTVPTNFSKLIRSDWFASNMYLLILGLVVPLCSLILEYHMFVYFTTYNSVYTICNLLFIVILNKHTFVTRYVFYISVCMIFAYVESDIVAVFYFILNSKGSLNNLKLTALRTVAIGLTLTLSFSSSMHIIRKLYKPQESLFEGLSEK